MFPGGCLHFRQNGFKVLRQVQKNGCCHRRCWRQPFMADGKTAGLEIGRGKITWVGHVNGQINQSSLLRNFGGWPTGATAGALHRSGRSMARGTGNRYFPGAVPDVPIFAPRQSAHSPGASSREMTSIHEADCTLPQRAVCSWCGLGPSMTNRSHSASSNEEEMTISVAFIAAEGDRQPDASILQVKVCVICLELRG